MSEQTQEERQRAREQERERMKAERERERAQREDIRNQARAHAREMREQARMVRDQAREIRDQAKQMADAQREIWRDFGEEIRAEINAEIHGIPRRKPQQPSLSLEQIVRAAIEIADREGNDAISMRRIASELKVGAMSLYWHVANKEELIQQMLDETYAEMQLPPQPTGDWRADMRTVASETRQVFLRHPWAAQIGPTNRSAMGPGFLRHAEFSFGAFEHTKISTDMRSDIVHVVDDYTIGFATREIMNGVRANREDETTEQVRTRTDAIFERIAKMGIFPVLTRLYREGAEFPRGEDLDRLFFFGLDSLLDGIAIRIAKAEGDGFTSRIGGRYV